MHALMIYLLPIHVFIFQIMFFKNWKQAASVVKQLQATFSSIQGG